MYVLNQVSSEREMTDLNIKLKFFCTISLTTNFLHLQVNILKIKTCISSVSTFCSDFLNINIKKTPHRSLNSI